MARNLPLVGYAGCLEITIGNATRADIRALTALRTAVAQELTHQHGGGPWSALPSRATVTRQLRASNMLVARNGTEIVGTVRLIRANPLLLDASAFTPVGVALYLIGLAVAPRHRSQGVGRALVDACKAIACAWPAQALWLDAYEHPAGAGGFYVRCGFRKVGLTLFKDAPQAHHLSFYEWRTTTP
jgi:ribosomal protein S18 acetylase RimI-like enzyme